MNRKTSLYSNFQEATVFGRDGHRNRTIRFTVTGLRYTRTVPYTLQKDSCTVRVRTGVFLSRLGNVLSAIQALKEAPLGHKCQNPSLGTHQPND